VVEYSKPWLSVDEQVDQLHRRGVHVPDRAAAAALLREVGYYRLTGYLYPFRESTRTESAGRTSVTVLDTYRAGTTFTEAAVLLAFDRQLRLLVIEGVERIEVAIRTHLAHVLGRSSPFAHEDATTFTDAFTARHDDRSGCSECSSTTSATSPRITPACSTGSSSSLPDAPRQSRSRCLRT
jgi:abortive infection bacteriophage resistance protein